MCLHVTSDEDTKFHKGQTVMNEQERYEAVRHCRYVDEVVKACPWECTIDFLKSHKIDFIAHDDIPYATDGSKDIYQPFKDADMFLTTQRTEGISTTEVIGRILKDYDGYLKRNISRGLTRHELNISYVKEKQLLLENNLQTIAEKGSRILDDIGSRRRRIVASLEDLYQECSTSFVNFFGNRGALRHWLSGTTRTLRGVVEPTGKRPHSSLSLPPSPISILDKADNESDDSNDNSNEDGYNPCTSIKRGKRMVHTHRRYDEQQAVHKNGPTTRVIIRKEIAIQRNAVGILHKLFLIFEKKWSSFEFYMSAFLSLHALYALLTWTEKENITLIA
ncbi:hypothetical protein ACTXT7_004744 [Hymenolepis weldensis]